MSWALSQCPCVAHHIFVAEFYLGSFHMIAHTHVCYRRQEFVFAVSVGEACACFCLRVCQCMCSRSKPSSAVTTPVTATVLNYKESVVMGSFAVSMCCTPHFCCRILYLGSFQMIAHTHVCYRRQEFVFAVSVWEACTCFCLRVRQCMCSRSKPSSDLNYKESVVMGSFAVSMCCTPHFLLQTSIWGQSI